VNGAWIAGVEEWHVGTKAIDSIDQIGGEEPGT
jgi:hypothetical protein